MGGLNEEQTVELELLFLTQKDTTHVKNKFLFGCKEFQISWSDTDEKILYLTNKLTRPSRNRTRAGTLLCRLQ